MKSVYFTPESELSGQKGTVILPSNEALFCHPLSLPVRPKSNEYVHVPLRFTHSLRSNCGRGYSGLGVCAFAVVLPYDIIAATAKADTSVLTFIRIVFIVKLIN